MKKPRLEPWSPTPATDDVIRAVKAMNEGKASDVQQRRVVDWLFEVTGTRDLEFRPESERASAFASGKRWVGLQLGKMIAQPLANISEERNAR